MAQWNKGTGYNDALSMMIEHVDFKKFISFVTMSVFDESGEYDFFHTTSNVIKFLPRFVINTEMANRLRDMVDSIWKNYYQNTDFKLRRALLRKRKFYYEHMLLYYRGKISEVEYKEEIYKLDNSPIEEFYSIQDFYDQED